MYAPFDARLLVVVLAAAAIAILVFWAMYERNSRPKGNLPADWAIMARPVFTATERRIYRLLREAFPHHVVLSKLPLVRFCQPRNQSSAKYWYDLLGPHNVTFAICSANGRVLAVIDLEADGKTLSRARQIKRSVLDACRVKYVFCMPSELPSAADLRMLIPEAETLPPSRATPSLKGGAPREINCARSNLASTVAIRRAEISALWQDSSLFQDSFFAPDSRLEDLYGDSVRGSSAQRSSESKRIDRRT